MPEREREREPPEEEEVLNEDGAPSLCVFRAGKEREETHTHTQAEKQGRAGRIWLEMSSREMAAAAQKTPLLKRKQLFPCAYVRRTFAADLSNDANQTVTQAWGDDNGN